MDGGDLVRGERSILQNALLLTGVNLLLRGVSMLFQIYLSGQIGAGGIGLLQLILTVGSFAYSSPEQLNAFWHNELDRYRKIADEFDIRIEVK